MKQLTFAFMATAILVTSAIASPKWETSSKGDRMYVDESPVYTPRTSKITKPLRSDRLIEKHWSPTCNAYMTEREERRNDETSGSRC
jgi:hypothetical protein